MLTRDDDPDQVVEAIEYFLENRDSHGNTDMAGQPFRVTGGVRYPRTYQDFPADPSITDVWPEGGPAAWWWAIVAAVGDREEGYWIRYRTEQRGPVQRPHCGPYHRRSGGCRLGRVLRVRYPTGVQPAGVRCR